MTDSLVYTNQLNPLGEFIAFLKASLDTDSEPKKMPELSSNENRTRASFIPKQIRPSHIFAPEAVHWLESCAVNIAPGVRNTRYTIPLLGITNRRLPGYKKAGLNLFKTLVSLTCKADLNNLDQCSIEFGSRLPMKAHDFIEEINRQILLSNQRVKTKGRLTFYCHNALSTPATSDLEALRLTITNTMPTINFDWLDPSMDWEALWNPCSQLEPLKAKLENKLTIFLDQLIEQACAKKCNAILQRRNCFFDDHYLQYRKRQMLPELNKVIYLPNSDIQNNRIYDLFKAEKNLLSHVSKKSYYENNSYSLKESEEGGWLPAII